MGCFAIGGPPSNFMKTIDRPIEDYSIAPPLEPWVREELTRIFGLNRYDEPNMKVVWGGNERERKADGRWGLKYWLPNRSQSVLAPVKANGIWRARIERIEVGLPRWVIERFMPPEKLSLVERLAHPRGRYIYYYEVEDLQGEYRPVGRDTIEHVCACMAAQDANDAALDAELQRLIDEDNAPVGHVIGSNLITPEIHRDI